jgi:hypothetical protein
MDTKLTGWRSAAAVGAGMLVTAALATPATAKITEYPVDPSATPLAKAMARDPSLVRRAVFSALPPSAKPAAVSTTGLAGFPTNGSSFAMLSTGNASLADNPNNAPDSGSESRGPAIRGARDVVIMRVDLKVPAGANCLSFDFRFLSEEYPEFVGDAFNDAFIAELGHSTWTAATKDDPTIKAPDNFAVDSTGAAIRINKVGVSTMRSAYAKGTTYDGATRRLRASTRIKPGNRRLYLSIFDQGDRIYDSAVFLDNLRVSHAKACSTGVRAAS